MGRHQAPRGVHQSAFDLGYAEGQRDTVKLITDMVSFKCLEVKTFEDAANLHVLLMDWMTELRKQNKLEV